MDHLEKISLDDLQAALEEVEKKQPTQRLLAAIAYKNGVSQTELAEWLGVERKTIYNWLSRLEGDDLVGAVRDKPRKGRKRKLTESQFEQFTAAVHRQPTAVGFDEHYWTPVLVQEYLRDRFDVYYSLPSCRRLMKEAGLEFHPSTGEFGSGDTPEDAQTQVVCRNGGVWKPTD